MAGRRIVDVSRLVSATKHIAKAHLELRSRQYDAFTKTSTVAKGVKSQTDRVTVTLGAAIAIAKRLAEEPINSATAGSATQTTTEGTTQSQNPPSTGERPVDPSGINQDHHYEASEKNSAFEAAPASELRPSQEHAGRHPLPDGTIPPEGLYTVHDAAGHDTYDRPPLTERAKAPLGSSQRTTGDHIPQSSSGVQGSTNEFINADTFDTAKAHNQTSTSGGDTAAESIPEGIDLNVFRTSRGKTLLDSAKLSTQKPAPIKAAETIEEAPEDIQKLAQEIAAESVAQQTADPAVEPTPKQRHQLRESAVPSSRFGRFMHYGSLVTGLAMGAVSESVRRVAGGSDTSGSLMLSPANLERLVAKLSRMRGAALKMGQMISFQDLKLLPGPIQEVLQRVQDSADYMPARQRDQVLAANLGASWRELFASFDEVPMAAASIGQVHRATLRSTGQEVAVKVQYPGVATSIDSDLNNLSLLLTASRLLPKGMYLDKTITNARVELAWECDYVREAECGMRFRSLLKDDEAFTVPAIFPEACGAEVLTAELMDGTAVAKMPDLTQDERDWIGTQLLRLCLREITEFRYMQTDPNWTNFLYNRSARKLELLDFGATREYPLAFIAPYVGILRAAARDDRETIRALSVELGYLTGQENARMTDAHVDSVLTLAEPFAERAPRLYDFRDQTITDRVRDLIPTMLKERLAPPPEETYSLHRKLSGAFLLCARLGSRVRCRDLFENAVEEFEKRKGEP